MKAAAGKGFIMNIRFFLSRLLKDFFASIGFFLVLAVLLTVFGMFRTLDMSMMWTILLLSTSVVLFRFALVPPAEIREQSATWVFPVCFFLADLPIIAWLWFFSPGKMADTELLILYTVIILAVKVMVHFMMISNGKTEARLLNDKLEAYRGADFSKD